MPSEASSKSRTRIYLAGAAGLVLLVAAVGVGARLLEAKQASAWSDERAIPTVKVSTPKASSADDGVSLPGQLQAYNTAPIYPRVSGYVRAWLVDIGANVRAGQTLAVIDTPELDQDIAKARADLENATANERLSRLTANRWKDMLASDAVSHQEADEKAGDLAAKVAAGDAARANLQRLLALKAFTRITAPFDGVVTARNIDVGDLVNAGAGGAAQALFTVSNISKIRVYVQVPQAASAAIRPGLTAALTLPEYPGKTFLARYVTGSGAIGEQSGALLVELSAENLDGALKPGAYADVKLQLPALKGGLRLPVTVLIYRAGGAQVAVVDSASRVVLRDVKISRDLGSVIELASGVSNSDRVVDSPPDSLQSGDLVRVVTQGGGA